MTLDYDIIVIEADMPVAKPPLPPPDWVRGPCY